jgi:eukaryotic translation initiation factor 2C
LGYDPARDSLKNTDERFNKNIDLPPEAYMRKPMDSRFMQRPEYNTNPTAKDTVVSINQFKIKDFGNLSVFQHDIAVHPAPKSPVPVIKKLWKSVPVRDALRKAFGPAAQFIVHDGRKLAWTTAPLRGDGIRIKVDLDEGSPRNRQDNVFMFVMKTTTKVDLNAIKAYLSRQSSWDNAILEGMNFLDHVLRQHPSQHLIPIKRNFYNPNETKVVIDAVVEVAIGAYASIRMNSVASGSGLGINLDVANTAMWSSKMLPTLIRCYLELVEKIRIPEDHLLGPALAPIRGKTDQRGKTVFFQSPIFRLVKRFYKLKFVTPHQKPINGDLTTHTFKELAFAQEYGEYGMTARTYKIEWGGKNITLEEYYHRRYNIRLRCANLPLVATNKKGTYFPMELCKIIPNQRYMFKLTADQTAAMIKIAVTRPKERKEKIMEKHRMLNWERDPILRNFGITMEPEFTKAPARVLKPPTIEFGNKKKLSPGTTGRWNLQNVRFFNPGVRPLRYWGFIWLEGPMNLPEVERFAKDFIKIYKGHGGVVLNENPRIWDEGRSQNPAESIERCQLQLLNDSRGKDNPVDLLFVVFQFRNANGYQRVKKSGDCRYGILTQCVLANHVRKSNAQYHSNVAMKVNAKMGGATNRLPSANARNPFFNAPTMFIGADVSHGTPGVAGSPSVASFVMSVDDNACRYAASAETNGWSEEIILEKNIKAFITRMMPAWGVFHAVGHGPAHIIYFRDGVSEGQFAHVLARETTVIKEAFKRWDPHVKVTTIVATKRHHIRMFPAAGGSSDRNGNPLPGTIVEKEVTHPHHFDFYLCSHVAIQGTARPVHYHVLEDEVGWAPNKLQQMIYEQCYTYARSTTPVSIHPAIYYAHIAGNRARVHEHISSTEGPRAGPKAVEHSIHTQANVLDHDMENPTSSNYRDNEPKALLKLAGDEGTGAAKKNTLFFRNTMWFI